MGEKSQIKPIRKPSFNGWTVEEKAIKEIKIG